MERILSYEVDFVCFEIDVKDKIRCWCMRCPERRRRRRSVSATAVTSDPAPCSTDAFEKRVSPLCWYAATLSRRQRADSSVPDRIGSTGGTGASGVGLGMCTLGRRFLPCWAATCGPLHGTKMAPLPYTTTTHTHTHTHTRARRSRTSTRRPAKLCAHRCLQSGTSPHHAHGRHQRHSQTRCGSPKQTLQPCRNHRHVQTVSPWPSGPFNRLRADTLLP